VFTPDFFNVIKKNDEYDISSKDGQFCLKISFYENEIIVYKLEKCNTNGSLLLNLVEKFAEKFAEKMPNYRFITLIDDSKINTKCKDDEASLGIDLATLKILTKGMSWYNSLGYVSSNFEEEKEHNDEILKMPFEDALQMATNNKNVKTTSKKILDDAHNLFPDINMQMETGAYVNKLVESINYRFDSSDDLSCQKYKFIKDLVDILSYLLEYDFSLFKRIRRHVTGGKTKKKKTKRRKIKGRKTKGRKVM
jgi:hypothetical protein